MKSCIICSNNNFERIISKRSILDNELLNVQCGKCGFIFTLGQDDEIEKIVCNFYRNNYYYKKQFSSYFLYRIFYFFLEKTGLRYVNPISQFNLIEKHLLDKKSLEFLDIGCGFGQMLQYLERKDKSIYLTGLEMDPLIVNYNNQRLKIGKVLYISDINHFLKDNKKKYDIIFLSHVLEHLTRPDIVLSKLNNILNKDGVLYIEIPNCENQSILKQSTEKTVEHLSHFTYDTFDKLIRKNCFKIVDCEFCSLTYDGKISKIIFSLSYLLKLKKEIVIKKKSNNGEVIRTILKKS